MIDLAQMVSDHFFLLFIIIFLIIAAGIIASFKLERNSLCLVGTEDARFEARRRLRDCLAN